MPTEFDAVDRRILLALERGGRLPVTALARQVDLTPSSCLRRVRRMEGTGVIDWYVALAAPVGIGQGLTVFARVWLTAQDPRTVGNFSRAMQRLPQVVECHQMSDLAFHLRIVAADLEDYRRFQLRHLIRIRGVESIKSEVPLHRLKLTTELRSHPHR